MKTASTSRGCTWLLEPGDPSAVLTPERVSDELRMIGQTAREFSCKEVVPAIPRLEQKDWGLARQLLRRSGELGLLSVDVPEEFGGVGLDKTAALVVSRNISGSASFSALFGAHGNLVISAILFFGTPEQKKRYLPGLASGELVGAYALSESGSGSDALSASTRATRLPDGSFALSGEKMWITNGGFADLFVVFAKIDGEQFSAFLVERGFTGVTPGPEEHKMGLHGSSTTPLLLQDARVPAANLLGEIGKGHKVAFNVLNFGRFKLGASCVGGAVDALAESSTYALSRRQFDKPIAEFGAIQHKLAEMTVQIYAVESLLYRTAGLIDSASVHGGGPDAVLAAMEEFAVEASIAKVAGSEMLDYVLDENVQIHGGNGFVKDYAAERHFRDARVNRIFEGTNEINRLLIPGMIMKRAAKGTLALIPAARKLQDEVLSPSLSGPVTAGGDLQAAVQSMKKVALMTIGLAMQRFGEEIVEQQEVLLLTADILINTVCAESAWLRAASVTSSGQLHRDAAAVYIDRAGMRVESAARQVLAAMAEGDTLRTHLAALKRLLKIAPINSVALRRNLAAETLRRTGYIFQ